MIGPYELDILLFLKLQAEVGVSSVDLGQAFINEYAPLRVVVLQHSKPIIEIFMKAPKMYLLNKLTKG